MTLERVTYLEGQVKGRELIIQQITEKLDDKQQELDVSHRCSDFVSVMLIFNWFGEYQAKLWGMSLLWILFW